MTARIPANIREDQINNLPNIKFLRWHGDYRNSTSKALCKCDIDGYEWPARVNDLLSGGKGCPKCAGNIRYTPVERIAQINSIENVEFIEWDGEYRNAFSKAKVRCLLDGYEWSAKVDHLVNTGSKCPQCADRGFNPTKRGTLYALRSECGTMVKIGISNNIDSRMQALRYVTPFKWCCVELCSGDGSLIAALEKVLHDMMEPVEFDTVFNGHTEWRKWDNRIPKWFDMYRSWS